MTASKVFQAKKVLGRKPPKFELGDAVIYRHSTGVEHAAIVGIAYEPPGLYGDTDEAGNPVDTDTWFYQIRIYQSSDPEFLTWQDEMQEKGIWEDWWIAEYDLEHQTPKVKVQFYQSPWE